MLDYKKLGTVLAVAAALTLPTSVDAQVERPWMFDIDIGAAFPVGDLEDTHEVGTSFGVGIGYWVNPRIALRADGSLHIAGGKDVDDPDVTDEIPDFDFWNYQAGLTFAVTPRDSDGPLNVTATALAGGTTLDIGADAVAGPAVPDFTETYFSAAGNLRVGYEINRTASLYVDGGFNWVSTDEGETGLDSAWTLPLQFGVQFNF